MRSVTFWQVPEPLPSNVPGDTRRVAGMALRPTSRMAYLCRGSDTALDVDGDIHQKGDLRIVLVSQVMKT
jgi:hypothetical protein